MLEEESYKLLTDFDGTENLIDVPKKDKKNFHAVQELVGKELHRLAMNQIALILVSAEGFIVKASLIGNSRVEGQLDFDFCKKMADLEVDLAAIVRPNGQTEIHNWKWRTGIGAPIPVGYEDDLWADLDKPIELK